MWIVEMIVRFVSIFVRSASSQNQLYPSTSWSHNGYYAYFIIAILSKLWECWTVDGRFLEFVNFRFFFVRNSNNRIQTVPKKCQKNGTKSNIPSLLISLQNVIKHLCHVLEGLPTEHFQHRYYTIQPITLDNACIYS